MGQDSRRKKTNRRKAAWYAAAHYKEIKADRRAWWATIHPPVETTRVFRLHDVAIPEFNTGFDGRRSAAQRARDAAVL